MSPLVSIIIPCYNGEGYVAEAIQSALDQTHPYTEVIVIDDGSTDGSLGVIQSFGGRVQWETGPNRGGGAARNLGLERASGTFVQFLDADDCLDSECVAQKVQALQRDGLSPCSDWRTVDVHGRVREQRVTALGDSVLAVLSGRMLTSAPLHRRSDLQLANGFDPDLPCSQERDLHLRLACQGVRFARVNRSLFTVRRRAGSISSDSTRVLLQHHDIYLRGAGMLRHSGLLTDERRFGFALALAVDARRLYHRGLTSEARRYWLSAASLDPVGVQAAYGRPYTRTMSKLIGHEIVDRSIRLATKARRYLSAKAV